MSVRHVGNGLFLDSDSVTPDEWKSASRPGRGQMRWSSKSTKAIRWLEESGGVVAIHPYAEFVSAERADVGLALVRDGNVVEKLSLTEVRYNEPQGLDVMEIRDLPSGRASYVYEEYPLVNVKDERDFSALLESHLESYPQWAHLKKPTYTGPGVYDARDMTKSYQSAAEYEIQALENEADQLVDYIFAGAALGPGLSGYEWIQAFEDLVRQAQEKSQEECGEEDDDAD